MVAKYVMLVTTFFHISILTSTSNAWRPYEIKFTNISFQSANRNFRVNFTVNNSVVDAYINLKETIQVLFIRPEVYLDLGNGKYEFEFMNRTVDVCRFFRDDKYEPLIQIVYKSISPYSNFAKKCPIPKKFYYLKQLRISSENFPPGFPERKAFLQLKYFKKINQSLELLGVLSLVINVEKKYKSSDDYSTVFV